MTLAATPLVTLTDIQAAQTLLAGWVGRTPLVQFPGRDLWLKAENLQPTGAFKLRGAFNKLLSLSVEQRARGVVAHSSGNHAGAVAYAARALGVPAVVVMPSGAPQTKLAATRACGAEVVLMGEASEERAAKAAELARERGLTPVPPYDDPQIIAGAATVGLEILHDLPTVGTVLVPVSGGGLISGVAAAIKSQRPDVRVIGVEPELAADAQASLRAGRRMAWAAADVARTLADGLRVTELGELTWEHIRSHVDDIVTVGEADIRRAVCDTALKARLVAEPSGAVTVAALYGAHEFGPGPVVAVVSGGNLDVSTLITLQTSPDPVPLHTTPDHPAFTEL
ncbi:serine/threonine dehydratase [Deinococcus aerolatus]|uniref:Serine/threonine dehydratase n=1 Tax=Deinococcus aerolatus TaxID=522487 RepID=A0ABQ2G239_9DEIO|nr:threonine/serine dehydratase [Deinococcus aerolatus]GGL71564.1 serine/threonine dehydratase [Deinococcus aerolatus]